MATLTHRMHGVAALGAPSINPVRNLDVVTAFGQDVTMGSATDVINLGTLPKGTVVMGVVLEQLKPGTGTGTLVARVGTVAASAALTATDAAGTIAAGAGTFPIVLTADTEFNLLGATAIRADGAVRAHVIVTETSFRPINYASVARDTSV